MNPGSRINTGLRIRNILDVCKISSTTYGASNLDYFFFSSRRRHTRLQGDWSSDVCSSDLVIVRVASPKETLWATEQALVSNACGAVLAWPQGAKYAELRRLQIAAEGGRAQIGRASCRERV